MTEHRLKTIQPYFDAIAAGAKTFELRFDDRAFAEGDELVLAEWTGDEFTGREERRRITFVAPLEDLVPLAAPDLDAGSVADLAALRTVVLGLARVGRRVAEPVGVVEIAERCGVTRGAVDAWRARYTNFPTPRWTVGGRPAWDWSDIEAWRASRTVAAEA